RNATDRRLSENAPSVAPEALAHEIVHRVCDGDMHCLDKTVYLSTCDRQWRRHNVKMAERPDDDTALLAMRGNPSADADFRCQELLGFAVGDVLDAHHQALATYVAH